MHTFSIAAIQLTAPAMPGTVVGLLVIAFLAAVVGVAAYLVVRHVRAEQARQAIERDRELDELARDRPRSPSSGPRPCRGKAPVRGSVETEQLPERRRHSLTARRTDWPDRVADANPRIGG